MDEGDCDEQHGEHWVSLTIIIIVSLVLLHHHHGDGEVRAGSPDG